ncbi:MAG: neuraminidase-like domain-containing protein [Pseudomonadota bacterium]
MAKKTEVVKNTKTKKVSAITGAKPIVKTAQTKAAVTRKPAATAKPPAKPGAQKTVSKKPPQDEGSNYTIYGTVVYDDASPVDGLTVIAYDKDVSGEDDLGKAVVKAGRFEINYRDTDFRKTKEERGGADVIVCVLNDKEEILFTSRKKNNAPAKYELNITLPAAQFVVRGTVTDANRKPLANMFVRAYERALRHPQLLGAVETKEFGEYRIAYSPADFQLGDVPSRRVPWLIVEVRASTDGEVLARQEVQKAARDQTVLFTLPSIGAVSEWQRVSEAVAPLLKGQGGERADMATRSTVGDKRADLAPYDITPADVGFIVSETGLDRAAVEAWAASSRMTRDAVSRLTDEFAVDQSLVGEHGWPFFYGLARQGLASDLDAALRASQQGWEKAWKAAQFANRVPALNEKQVTSLMNALQLLQRLQQIDPQRGSNSDLAKILAGLSQPLPKAIALDALAIVQEKGLNDIDALLKLTERHPDADAPIKTFVRGVRVHQLTAGHEGFSRVVNARLAGSSDSIAPLARLLATDWIGIAKEAGVNSGLALQTQAQVEIQHPLTAMESKIHAGLFDLPGLSGSDAAALIKNQPTLVEKLLRGKVPVKADEATNLTVLRNTGRFLRTGVSMELAADIIKSGIRSPGMALRYGREHLREQNHDRLPKEAVSEVIDGFIGYTHGLVEGGKGVTLGIDINRRRPGRSWLEDLGEYRIPLPESVRENAPTLAALFGDSDECMCRPCESMLGQPAYLIDLLNLLKKYQEKSGNALDELRRRRPDIFDLKLSCEKAEATIQHIDIVLGILERAAVPEPDPNATDETMAYRKLRQCIYPWPLPFDRGYAEVSAYLAKLGVSREKLLGLRLGTIPSHLAAEVLHVPMDQAGDQNVDSQWALLTRKRRGAQLWAAYGFDIDNDIAIVDPASREELFDQTVEDVLTRASFLIVRTGLTLDELDQALKTEFVAGYPRGIGLCCRYQCKTSAMRLQVEGPELEGILDRLHRFTRLKAKFPEWTIEQLGDAISASGGIEAEAIADQYLAVQARADVFVKLTIIMRLHKDHGLALDALLEGPLSEARLRQALGLSLLQFKLLKEITDYPPTEQSRNWFSLESLCNAAKRLREIGLSVEQASQALLTRTRWEAVAGELPPSIKTDKQIEALLGLVQQRLRSVVAVKPDVSLEAQAVEALNEIYDQVVVARLVKAIQDAGAAIDEHLDVLPILRGNDVTRVSRKLGEWLPLLTVDKAEEIIALQYNHNAPKRFELLLNCIASRRRERELLTVIAEQCGLAEPEVIPLLGARLLLNSPQGNSNELASVAFLESSFWDGTTAPRVAGRFSELHDWTDRLYRLKALSTALAMDNELMQIADKVVVRSVPGINWSEMLSAVPVAGSNAWQNPQWQALLDLLWLQQPEQLSCPALGELFSRLAAPGARVSMDTLRPLTARVDISETPDTLAMELMAQAISVQSNSISTLDLRNPGKLRVAFEWLLLAKQLGADATKIAVLLNQADNASAADTARSLLESKLAGEVLMTSLQKIDDSLRRQRRDALVAYHVAQVVGRDNSDKWIDAKALYEHFLIDHQMEPCFETTPILEAVTAVQLFVQRILFGIERGITAGPELKQRWTWMRNYRVWEANRKVFLFPENWLFPELRDDKSSSFKQLESALGQGELTQDLANQAFGQFLDDVAQMGQIEVLGMYEDISRDADGNILGDEQDDGSIVPRRRTLYVVGRTPNPPYAYFWRHCVDFGSPSPHMEWSPWHRIELDIQGDHVLPFVLSGCLYIAWPLIRAIRIVTGGVAKDGWEVKLAWSRHDGKNWRKASTSRALWSGEAAGFSDERRGFSFRGEKALDDSKATIFVYTLTDELGAVTEIDRPSAKDPTPSEWDLMTTYPGSAVNPDTAYHFLDTLIRNNYSALPEVTKKQLEIYATWRKNIEPPIPAWQGDLLALMEQQIFSNTRVILFSNPEEAAKRYKNASLPNADTRRVDQQYIEESTVHFLWAYWGDAQRSLPQEPTSNYAGFNSFYYGLQQVSSRRTVICKAWIKLRAPDGTNPIAYIPLKGDENEGVYTCRIGTETIPFDPSVPYPMDWKLGDQPALNCTLSLSPRIRPTSTTILEAPRGEIYTLGSIVKGSEVTQTVHFVIDGTMHEDATDIGFDLDALKSLTLVAKFHLTRDDMVTKLTSLKSKTPIYNPVGVSQPWMNGFRETAPMGDPEPVSPLNIDALNPAHRTNIFSPTKAGQFWAVGATTSKREEAYDVVEEVSSVWHFSESESGCYIDLGYRLGLADSGFRVYPDAFPEATLRRSDWSQSRTLPVAQNQISDFGAKNLPIPANDSSTSWTDVLDGVYTFDARLPYACYNWEVFFHAPLLIADQLSKQHKFEDAERWLRYVFDPTSSETGPDAKRFLKFRVFKDLDLNQQVIDDLTLLAQVAGGFGVPGSDKDVKKLIDRWRDAPFRPFLIARRRHIAFLWLTLFAYLDNLIAWGDSLYRRDTRESINEATMLYVLAERILGHRPQLHKGMANREAYTYDEKMDKWDDFANFWIDVGAQGTSNLRIAWRVKDSINQPNPDGMLYFCMPLNDKIASYWDTVDARLSNIRNCRNIEGIKRNLPLMDAPIDPELLIRATAAGLDLGDVIAGLYAPPPHYRYGILSARAAELTNEAKALGAAMLSAIEKRDAEHLVQLRSSNEISLLKLVKEVRTLQITEAERNIESLRGSRRTIESRYNQYQRLLGIKDIKIPEEGGSAGDESMLGSADSGLTSKHSNWGLIKEEDEQYLGIEGANTWSSAAAVTKVVASGLHASSSIVAASMSATPFPNPPKVLEAIGNSVSNIGDSFSFISQGWRIYAEQQGMLAGHIRRRDEWAFQSNQSLKELQQIDKQILANQIRIDITAKELNNHIEQIEQAKAIDEVMRSKFSNEQLYEWMKTELSKLYFNAYRMALEMARKAERAASRELGVKPLNILGNAYWDSLRDGLLAGERLHQDLKRLEITYLDQNRREFELTKHISLRRLKPQALVNLRIKDGDGQCKCEFNIPEWLFDLDTPGHYLRRIKSVSVSIPSVVGPYTSINCKLTLLESHVRHVSSLKEQNRYLHLTASDGQPVDDDRFTDYFGATEAIVTSTGSNDSGLFETQLRDERFLPFEGSGVISRWRLELPGEYPQFDYSTISDVVLSIRYTARDGGDSLRDAASAGIATLLSASSPPAPLRFPVVLSCRSDFPAEWARANATTNLEILISRKLLPYWLDAVRPKLEVRAVRVADIPSVSMPTFNQVWPTRTGGLDTALDAKGMGMGNFGKVAPGVADRVLILDVGLP